MKIKQLVGQCYNELYAAIYHMSNPVLKEGTLRVIEDPDFLQCFASKTKHQAYAGGLVVHTAEVLRASIAMSKMPHLKCDYDILVASVIWHDYGKLYDYVSDPGMPIESFVRYTPHRARIRHLSRSYAMFMKEFDGRLLPQLIDDIGHCILSHHGRQEWGSPVDPQTTEAHILHFADCLSAFCSETTY